MTEPIDDGEQLDDDLVARFESLDTVEPPDVWRNVSSSRGPSRGTRRWMSVLVAAGVVAVLAGALMLVAQRNESARSDSVATGVESTPPPGADAGSTPSSVPLPSPTPPSVASSSAPSTISDSTNPTTMIAEQELEPVRRPFVDPTICPPIAARDNTYEDFDLRPFALSQHSPRTLQVIANPSLGAAGRFTLLERFEPGQLDVIDRAAPSIEVVDLDGIRAILDSNDRGFGSGFLVFPDRSEGYIRARGLNRAELEAVIRSVAPRPADSAVPGFDYDPTIGPPGLDLVEEQNGSISSGRVATFECQLADEIPWIYRIQVIDGTAMFGYVTILDRPAPLEVDYQHDSLVVINGQPDPRAPTVSDVTNAPDEVWTTLLDSPDADERSQTPSDQPDTAVPGTAATWTITPDHLPAATSTSFTAYVTRLGCSGGVTGTVFEPTIATAGEALVVTFTVEAIHSGRCPNNEPVPYTVELNEPLGTRTLVDGACNPGGAATGTSSCTEGGVRFRP